MDNGGVMASACRTSSGLNEFHIRLLIRGTVQS